MVLLILKRLYKKTIKTFSEKLYFDIKSNSNIKNN